MTNLTGQQQRAVHAANSGRNVFVTGGAGTGKSTTLKHIVLMMKGKFGADKVYVTASTGCAARNVGGVTLHSAFGVGTMPQHESLSNCVTRLLHGGSDRHQKKWNTPKVVVIDEVSMLSSKTWDKFDNLGRVFRQEMEKPWGGIQIIVFGDFLQLPPVGDDVKPAFAGQLWKQTNFYNCVLTEVHRQRNSDFSRCLRELRLGTVSDNALQLLRSRIKPAPPETTLLLPSNKDVDKFNNHKLEELSGNVYEYDFPCSSRLPVPQTLDFENDLSDCDVKVRRPRGGRY